MSTAPDFDVVPLVGVDIDQILSVLVDAFDDKGDPDWYRWKHLEGPWGSSQGWVAHDDDGILGVLCCLPWTLDVGGRRVVASRLVDGGTTARARRRGVFSTLVARELEEVRQRAHPLVFCTATPEAAAAHVRNGATELPHLVHRYGIPSLRRPARLQRGMGLLAHVEEAIGPVVTAWDTTSMRWRLDPRSGHGYQVNSLVDADDPCGAAFRVISRRGLRTIVLTHVWGGKQDRARLLASICIAERAPSVLAPASGQQLDGWHPLLARGASRLCVWDLRAAKNGVDLHDVDTWALTGADLEGVV